MRFAVDPLLWPEGYPSVKKTASLFVIIFIAKEIVCGKTLKIKWQLLAKIASLAAKTTGKICNNFYCKRNGLW